MTVVKISECFHYIINLLCYVAKLVGMICKLDRFLENLQIVQRNLQIGQIGRLDGTNTRIPIFAPLALLHKSSSDSLSAESA